MLLLLAASCKGRDSIPPPGPFEDVSEGIACAASPIYLLVSDLSDSSVTKVASFDPKAAQFNVLGTVKSPDILRFYGPMAVDHAGQIYATDNAGCGLQRIYRINAATLAVESTPAAQSRDLTPQANSPCIFSMTFVADAISPSGETLYLNTVNSYGDVVNPYRLGRVDPTSSAILDVAGLTGSVFLKSVNHIALTGTAKGEFYAALDAHASPGVGTEIDSVDLKTGAATFRWQLNQVPPAGYANYHAFTIWGGDFYFFIASATLKEVDVIRFRPSDASTTRVAMTTEFYLVAVASSQCASGG